MLGWRWGGGGGGEEDVGWGMPQKIYKSNDDTKKKQLAGERNNLQICQVRVDD